MAVNGLDSPGLLKLLQDAPCARFDVAVLSMGANDAPRLCAPLLWARWQTRPAELIDLRFAPALLVHSAVPPMQACQALPQPLRSDGLSRRILASHAPGTSRSSG